MCAHIYLPATTPYTGAIEQSGYSFLLFRCFFIYFFISIKLYPKTHFDLLLSGLYDRFYYFIVLKEHIYNI